MAGSAVTSRASDQGRSETRSASEVDVAIVGAGAAGLVAAKRLIAAGHTVLILEARDRIGGRILTDRRLGAPFDAGAVYLHWAERNPWRGIATSLGAELREEEGGGFFGIFADGIALPSDIRARRWSAFRRLDGLIAAGSRPDRSVADAAKAGGGDPDDGAGGLTRLTLGEEPDRVSSADYDQLWAGDDLLLPEGFGTLVTRFGAGLPVRLSQPVRRIDWSGRGVALETSSGTLRAKCAIVTVPIGVLQADAIAFRPALPAATRDAIGGLGMGAYTKIALRIDRAALGSTEIADAIDVGSGPDAVSFDVFPFGRDLVLCLLGGDHARRLCEAGEAAAVDHVTERFGRVFGANAKAAVRGGVLCGWWSDPFSRGSYSIARPGRLEARLALRQPIGGRIWLAGEASAGGGAMTAGGAALEGERAANEIGRRLRKAS
ncbi:flavin monoamine oxidase family protein [Enterovirga rhinocerotis]|uniref:Tryptophan 2-monooxygenase n=1 Tax=Enterovirga rhinocerotis TaxID=1339210 RepID=A0A4V3DYM0_9HYPH|nr:NAD(P)/FAD-dependent oxidoreductase [Enterovirga rhinocerotis]TDR93119.1 monoamine oxidase [Enterovirga rhinocerotis]